MQETDGYLAPPLVGVWATAPYFHNGSVPDVRSVLLPSERPIAWLPIGTDLGDYDPERLGVRFTVASESNDDAVVTTRGGMSREGHDMASDLTEGEVLALLAYLKTL